MNDAASIAAAPGRAYEGQAYRHQAPRYSPLDGNGARLNGGRYTPVGSFPTLYLCTSVPCVSAELRHLGQRHVLGLDALLPRAVYRYEIGLTRVLDLAASEIRASIGISSSDLTEPDWSLTQQLGAAAHAASFQGILAPSALGVDEVLVVFPLHVGSGRVDAGLVEQWESSDDVPPPIA